jgi:agmatine deiminase
MPPEWAPHKRTWMEWPCRESLWEDGLEAAREAYAEVARTIAQFEPVTMIATPANVAEVSIICGSGSGVSAFPLEHDDSWMRDNGPTFVIDGKGGIAGVDWGFNGWGGKFPPYDKDAAVARAVLEHHEIERFEAPLIMEGGSFHVDGEGTLITTEQCLLSPNRNPQLSREQIEDHLKAHLGVTTVIWLGEGLEDDHTDGHVDNLCCFARPGVVLLQSCHDESDYNHKVYLDAKERLDKAQDARGRALEIIEIEQPKRRKGPDGLRMGLSYINFYLPNGGVVMPAFGDPKDEIAFETLSKVFEDRKVVQVEVSDILAGGGGIHCITQQQPDPAA